MGVGVKDIFGRAIPDNIRVVVRRDVLAEALWEYGEDELAERCLESSDEDLHQVHRLAVWHRVNDPEPEDGPRLTNGRILSRAMIEFVERRARDTKRRRRRTRPEKDRYDALYLEGLRNGRPPPDSPAERGHYPGWDS